MFRRHKNNDACQHEWSEWTTMERIFSRPTSYEKDGSAAINYCSVNSIIRWQQRTCILCKKVEEERLPAGEVHADVSGKIRTGSNFLNIKDVPDEESGN